MNEAKNGVNPSVKQERNEAERRRTRDTVEFENKLPARVVVGLEMKKETKNKEMV